MRMAAQGQQGGMWNTARVSVSAQTQTLLKTMMQESKLTSCQQNTLVKHLRDGKSLPMSAPPNGTYKTTKNNGGKKSQSARKNTGSGIRSKDAIEKSGAYEKPDYKPNPTRVRTEKDKERLANFMAYGKDIEPSEGKKKSPQPAVEELLPEPLDRFSELEAEIDDRRNFMDEMQKLGQGKKYRAKIEAEISAMIREMEVIDKKRLDQIEAALKQRKKQAEGSGTS